MKKRQRLLFITTRFGRGTGGLGVSAERIVGYFRSHYDIHVLTLNPDPLESETTTAHTLGLTISQLRPQRDSKLQLQQVNDWVCAQIVHEPVACVLGFYLGPWSYAGLLAARRFAVPFVGFARGNDIDLDLFGEGAFQAQYLLAHANRIFCVTTELEQKIKGFVPKASTWFIPNGVDPVQFPLLTATPRQDDPIIGIFGDIKQKKGLSLLLERLDLQTYQLRIVGTVRDDTAKLVHGFLSLHPDLVARITQVPFIKNLPDLLAEYAKCDVICIPSCHEGMSNVMLEAMSCGKLVLASNIGGARDVIESGKNGFLFNPAQPETFDTQLHHATTLALHSKNNIGQTAREHIAACFNWELERTRYLQALAALQREYLDKNPQASDYTHATSKFSAPAADTLV
ncbi:MAG: glycosyltransferase family 4 protein [Gammaproteobacteria bacterium]|nr:glycosyltransferase family 4 protein [Gammaproteobacteria bacterium]